MRFACVLVTFFIAAANAAPAAIDFTPTPSERILEGIKFPELIFHEDGRQIVYGYPRGWTYSGSSSRIKFTPPGLTQAQAEIEQSPLPAPQNFDEPTMKTLQDKVLTSVPKGSQEVSLLSEQKSPVMLNGNETYEVTIAYKFYGQEFQSSVLYLNLPGNQLRFRVTAKKADYEKVHSAFRRSILSFRGLKQASA